MSALDGPRAFVVAGIIGEIVAERIKQVRLGYTPAHDDKQTRGELATLAAMWAEPIGCATKPAMRRGDLIRAASLIVAEIERLDRVAS